jgi:hypothetical protein
MQMYHLVQFVVCQFDDPLQAGLMMKMDIFATILATHATHKPLAESSWYVIDCASVEFTGFFYEEALPNGPWQPCASSYPLNGDWLEWYRRYVPSGNKRKRI